MTERRQLDVITGPASTEPCCLPGLCAFSPAAVRFYRTLRRLCRETGTDPVEGAYTIVHAGGHDAIATLLRGEQSVSTETARERWADRILDVERAEQAGCRTAEQIARFLCPFAVEPEA